MKSTILPGRGTQICHSNSTHYGTLTAIANSVLEEALSSLSLEGEASSQESDLSRAINPVQEFPNAQPRQNELEDFIQDHLLPHLDRSQEMDRIFPDDPYFQSARDIWEREGWDGEGLLNYITLLCGAQNFPAIMLISPSNADDLPWNEMIQSTPTLVWLQQTLKPLGFALRDIIIIDAFPLLTQEKMDAMYNAETARLSNELFNLTVEFLRQFAPPAIISCQCVNGSSNLDWRFVNNHPLATPLRSSVWGARGREVAKIPLDAGIINVVQGFHPMHIICCEDPGIQSDLDQLLRGILETVYRPCADWKDQRRRECDQELSTAAETVKTTMEAFMDAMTVYDRAQYQATDFGSDSARLGNDYDIAAWDELGADVRWFVGQFLGGSLGA